MMSHTEVDDFLAGFVHDFERLDWPRFRARFAEDAMVFYPPRFQVADGATRAITDKSWATVFDAIRSHSASAEPPYMQLRPQDLNVQIWGDCALVTFTLNSRAPQSTQDRRTLLLHKSPTDGTRIVHLHGSTVA